MAQPTVPMQDWVDEMGVHAPGSSNKGSTLALRSTLREFCVDSGAWVRQLPAMNIKAGKKAYYTDPQPDATVLYIHSIIYESGDGYTRWLRPHQQPQSLGKSQQPSAAPVGFYGIEDTPGAFGLLPPPSEDMEDALRPYVSLSLKSSDCDTVPAHFKSLFYDVILDGALGRLCSQQDKPYTNPVMAQYHLRRFRNGISRARDMARRQYTDAETEFVFPAWA